VIGSFARVDLVNHFAVDVDPVKAKVQPLSASALSDVMGVPAWTSLPSWYLVGDGDQAIPPRAAPKPRRG
jgi:hypothetical protein